MKNYLKVALAGLIFLTLFIVFKNFYKQNDIIVKDDKLSWNVKFKGLKGAVDFTMDKQGGFYIAYLDKIQYIDSNGKSYNILKDNTLNISSIEFKDNNLYFVSENKLICYNLDKKDQKVLLNNLPNYGDYKESILRINGNELYISIGAATNSGVVGNDNAWILDNPFNYDISPKDITIRGKNFGSEKTGAFVPYKTKNIAGQLISGHFPGSASVINYNLSNGESETYAWGIRNIKSMSFSSEGKLIAAVGGMEDRGLRPVKGDVDYIYEIKKDQWYGWPDYSGGDPITSPRFKGGNNIKQSFILDNHPTTNPPAPIYTHKALSTLGAMDIDIKGSIGEKDCIYFLDTRDNMLYGIAKTGTITEKALFRVDSKIKSIRIKNNLLLALDSMQGVVYSLNSNNFVKIIELSKPIIYYLIGVILVLIIIIVWKHNLNIKDN
jgi:hypothetical protein